MKNLFKNRAMKGMLVAAMVMVVSSCDLWLDVVPDDMPTIDDAFGNRATTQKFLYSCYSYLPDPTHPWYYPAYFTSGDEFEWSTQPLLQAAPAAGIARGEQNASNPFLNYWSGGLGGTNLFGAIRTCNIFLENINNPGDIPEHERKRWIAEVKFLKAYYHFFLVKLYGPIPITRENLPISATPDEVMVFRDPVDECIEYIVQLLDEAAPDLPLVINNSILELGRITRPVASAVKAKALAWAASPLFNGNLDYADWRDKRGKQLISDTYSREKWVKTAEATREAIEIAHLAQHKLYRYNKNSSANTYRMNDSLVLTMHARKAITDKWNEGIIWSSMNVMAAGKGGASGILTHMQSILYPVVYVQDQLRMNGYCMASFNMNELFYSNNGIPIDEDMQWDYEGRHSIKTSTVEERNGTYIPIGEQTVSLHFNREPRFYANLCFDRGNFEISTATKDGGATFSPFVKMRSLEPATYCFTGYYVKKLIAFETSSSQGEDNIPFTPQDYRFPLIRLADLYLLYSEALNEIKERPDSEVYEWIDQVRAIYNLDGVVDAWKKSIYPERPESKTEMRKIIQQERMIELAFEGQRFWDVRRWKLAEDLWTKTLQCWTNGNYPTTTTVQQYYTLRRYKDARQFSIRDYLWPIKITDLYANTNLEQTYGW